MDASPRLLTGHPASPRNDRPPVERHRELEHDVWPPEGCPGAPRLVLAPRALELVELGHHTRRAETPRPATRLGARVGARGDDAAIPAETIRSTHGGVRPWCAHGSSVTKSVPPRVRSPASSSATISAWRPPTGSVTPSPTSSPSAETTTAPTVGLGYAPPAAASARSRARSRLTRPRAADTRLRDRRRRRRRFPLRAVTRPQPGRWRRSPPPRRRRPGSERPRAPRAPRSARAPRA